MRRFGFQAKLGAYLVCFVICLLLGTAFFFYRKAAQEQKDELRSKILSLAKLSSTLVNSDELFQADPAGSQPQYYDKIKALLGRIRDSDPVIDNVYTMAQTDKENIWIFLVDAGDRRGVAAKWGEVLDVSGFPQMRAAFMHPSVDNEMTQDRWGTWLSGYAPIYDKEGRAAAIIGLDIKADSIRDMQLLLAKRFLWILIVGLAFSLLVSWILARQVTRPLHLLTEGVKQVGEGNLDYRLNIKSRDEFRELADAFNKMGQDLLSAQRQLHRSFLNTIKSLAGALEAKDFYTRGHSERVKQYSLGIGKRMGFSPAQLEMFEEACLMHDVGKIGIPERILNKPLPLSDEEWKVMITHPKIGEEILRPVEFIKDALSVIRDHHERPDGKGYPQGLKAPEISRFAAIAAVADAFDAMTTDRPYRKALSLQEATEILKQGKGTQFDAESVDAFLDYLQENPQT